MRSTFGVALVLIAFGLAGAGPAMAGHGPTRQGDDACNGTDAFDVNNVVTTEILDAIADQNPGARRPDGTLDRSQVAHALLNASGHVALQVREKAGHPLERVVFDFSETDSGWSFDSTNHPGFLTAIDAQESESADADSDLLVGGTFLFPIPTDVVGDGNYVARMRAFRADGSEAGRVCIDATVSNGQNTLTALQSNTDPAHEPAENPAADHGFKPQPVVWFPAGEPIEAQQAGYGARTARIEFLEAVQPVRVEREEDLPAPTGLAGTPSETGGSLATATYLYRVTALNSVGETLASGEIGVSVTGPTGSVALSWDAVPGATGYRVYRGTSPGGQDAFHSSTDTTFTDTGATGTPGTPPTVGTAKIWVDYTSLLAADDFTRPHFVAGGRMDGSPFEDRANEKVWGPGFRFPFGSLPAESLPAERLRIGATDVVGKPFCGVYTFGAGTGGSFVPRGSAGCQ